LAYAGGVAAAGSGYRKSRCWEFLELVRTAEPRIIYHSSRMHFFCFDGFFVYTFRCRD
jgi:hypothetical protein